MTRARKSNAHETIANKKPQNARESAEDSIVEGNLDPTRDLKVGEAIAVVTYSDETARLTHGVIVGSHPLAVRMPEQEEMSYAPEGRVMLIVKGKTPQWRARTTIARSDAEGTTVLVEFADFEWELEDRRKYPRVAVAVPVELKLVHEQEDSLSFTEARGSTIDLSLGGAAVHTDTPVPVGTLVEFRWTPADGKTVRSLAVVLHQKPEANCIGIEFVNFIGEGRNALKQLLQEAA